MARSAACVFAFRESPRDVTSCKASKKIRTQIAMPLPSKIALSAIVDELVDVRLLTPEPPEGSVAISDITHATRGCQYKRFSRSSIRAALFAGRAVHCMLFLSPSGEQHRLTLVSSYLHNPLQVRLARRDETEVTEGRRRYNSIHHTFCEAHLTGEVIDQIFLSIDMRELHMS